MHHERFPYTITIHSKWKLSIESYIGWQYSKAVMDTTMETLPMTHNMNKYIPYQLFIDWSERLLLPLRFVGKCWQSTLISPHPCDLTAKRYLAVIPSLMWSVCVAIWIAPVFSRVAAKIVVNPTIGEKFSWVFRMYVWYLGIPALTRESSNGYVFIANIWVAVHRHYAICKKSTQATRVVKVKMITDVHVAKFFIDQALLHVVPCQNILRKGLYLDW